MVLLQRDACVRYFKYRELKYLNTLDVEFKIHIEYNEKFLSEKALFLFLV